MNNAPLEFDLVSLDVFGTLLDLQGAQDSFWHRLDASLSTEAVADIWAACDGIFFAEFEAGVRDTDGFRTTSAVFKASFEKLFREFDLHHDSAAAAGLYLDCLVSTPLYPDTRPFLELAGAKYPLCLSCDADNEMLARPRRLCSFKHVFTSEDLRTYKVYGNGIFFQKVVERSGVAASRIIHVGDTPIEMAGAKKAGLVTCWLNRTGKDWPYPNRPDYEVHSLLDVAKLVGVNDENDAVR